MTHCATKSPATTHHKFFSDLRKGPLDVRVLFGGSLDLEKYLRYEIAHFFSLLNRHLSLFGQITLVADQRTHDAARRVVPDFVNPLLKRQKCAAVCDVVDEYHSVCTPGTRTKEVDDRGH